MEIRLKAGFVLRDGHSKSRLKMPVLVNLRTSEAYNPSESVEAYPSWGKMQARDVVNRASGSKAGDIYCEAGGRASIVRDVDDSLTRRSLGGKERSI
jgi:hypothetical protein